MSGPLQPGLIERLGELLRDAGFAGERHESLRAMPGGVPPADLLALLDRPEDARLARLVRLFSSEMRVPRRGAEEAVRPLTLEELVRAGLVEVDASGARGAVTLSYSDGLLIAGDPKRMVATENYVANVSSASARVAHLAIHSPEGTALDVGTGSGVLALLSARRMRRAAGIDINPRALWFAELSQRLSGLENVTWAQGSWFDGVRDERYDLVMVNPPYVISPEQSLLYRDSAVDGDELSRELVRSSARHLTEGGYAVIGCSWIHGSGGWEDPLREWVADLGCDALLFGCRSYEPLSYALTWNRELQRSEAEFVEAVHCWFTHYERAAIERMATGVIVLRRRSGGSKWVRAFQLDGTGPTGSGERQLKHVVAGCDFLALPAGEQLQQLVRGAWRLVDGHRLDQALFHKGGAYEPAGLVLRQPGLNLSAQVDPRVLQVLMGCDGQHTLGDLIQQSPVPEGLDQGGFHSLCLATVKDLIARGFLSGDPLGLPPKP